MSDKVIFMEGEAPESQIGASLDCLFKTICSRKGASLEASYTARLLEGSLDGLLKKIAEESLETCLAAKECEFTGNDSDIDHMRYEAADVVYHLLVLLARFGIDSDELAAELNSRMHEDERPQGCAILESQHLNRGK